MRNVFDIDIDIKPRTPREKYGVRGMIYDETECRIQPHPSAVYLEDVPVDSVTGNCAFDYEFGDSLGFMKVDLLNNSAYSKFTSKDEVLRAVENFDDWRSFDDPDIVANLPHLGKHVETVRRIKPRSINDLADVLALIRPGKKHLLEAYLKNPEKVRSRSLYTRASNGMMYFKKSHAVSYAMMIVCTLYRNQNVGGIIMS